MGRSFLFTKFIQNIFDCRIFAIDEIFYNIIHHILNEYITDAVVNNFIVRLRCAILRGANQW